MSKEELVQSYVEGRINRRIFIRRLVALGVSVGAAMTYSQVLGTEAAAAKGGKGPVTVTPPDLYPPPGKPADRPPSDLYPPPHKKPADRPPERPPGRRT